MASQKHLALIDGHALAFRAFHAMAAAGLRSSSGEPTYAVFGFAQMLLAVIQEHHPAYVVVAFDVGRTFRHETYPDYKAHRVEAPEEFHPQLDRIRHLVQALNIPIATAEGYEADDVIGTLARQATAQGLDTLIVTGDTDTLQLVDPHVRVLLSNPSGRKLSSVLYTVYDEQKVRERYQGLHPAQLTDLRGLKGDASDNIPGVKGIGETGATNLLKQFGTVENLYDHLGAVDKRYRKHLEGQRDQALLSKHLATIVCDVPITLDVQAAAIGTYDRSAVIALFHELEFRSLVEKLPPLSAPPAEGNGDEQRENPPEGIISQGSAQLSMFPSLTVSLPRAQPSGIYQAVVTEDTLWEVVEALTNAPGFAFDTETTSVDPFQCDLVGISLAVQPGTAWYLPIGHREGQQLPRQMVLDTLRPFFADPQKQRYAHHAKFDIEVLLQAGIETHRVAFDTMIAAGLLGKRMGLKDLAFSELKLPDPMTDIKDLIGHGARQTTFDVIPIDQATPYAAADADMTLRLVGVLEPQLAAQTRIHSLFTEMEMPLVPVLVEMERAGIGLDCDFLRELSKRLEHEIASLTRQIHDLAGTPFNINSSIQLSEVLFRRLGLATEGLSKTSTGRYSLAADALEKLSGSHEIVRLILDYRHLSKLKSTYVDALPRLVNLRTGRVHTTFSQLGAATGRMASSSPNLQNIPVRTEAGTEIRRAFVAAPGCLFIAADYSQIELRVLAHITQDPNLMQAFVEGQDIHAATAAQLFGVPIDAVEKHQRRIAKTTVFGIIYGISSFGLSQRTDMSRTEAQALIDAFFARFPGVRDYMETTLKYGRDHGYVESLAGRRRAVPDLQTSGTRRQAAEREAINTPIQATAADIMKLAMVRVADALKQRGLQTRMLLQVHDELILEAPLDESAEVQQVVREAMENAYTLLVPLKVDVEVGSNWEQME
ncbi:MAG: DNA polymerase I [Chloroflexaceae bacterium]|nr:DNA polymerase I [Chloroflexaceae bacterium]